VEDRNEKGSAEDISETVSGVRNVENGFVQLKRINASCTARSNTREELM
jgi:hypothetical protein